jgi:hypothetical protein
LQCLNLDTNRSCGMDHIGGNREVVIKKLRWRRFVRDNAANLRGRKKDR